MLPALFPLIKASPAVTALIGAGTDPIADPIRFYRHGRAPQGVKAPYVTWSVPAGDAEITFDGPDADTFRVQVDCWSDSDTEIEALAAAVRAALEKGAHLIAYLADEQDHETRRFRMSFAFDFIKTR